MVCPTPFSIDDLLLWYGSSRFPLRVGRGRDAKSRRRGEGYLWQKVL
jgi:hypothetical protein